MKNDRAFTAFRTGRKIAAVITAISVTVSACSTTPRDFTPSLALSGAKSDTANADLADCRAQVADKSKSKSGETAAVVGGSAVGLGAGALTAGSAASGAGMLSGAVAGAGLAAGFALAAPVAIVVISKSIRSRKERQIRTTLTRCLQDRGYVVSDWQRTPR